MALGHWLKDYIGPHNEGGDPGYSCKTIRQTLFNGNVRLEQTLIMFMQVPLYLLMS